MNWSLGVLSWKCHETLTSVLRSYRDLGLLDMAAERLIFFQEVSDADRAIAERFDLRVLGSSRNIGCGPGMLELARAAGCEYLLLLENDWLLIEDLREQHAVLDAATDALSRGLVDAVRLRHRTRPGRPFWAARHVRGRESHHPSHLLWSVCWLEDPSLSFGDRVQRIGHGPDLFRARAAHADFSFNPCLYRTELIRDVLARFDFAHEHPLRHEAQIQEWWCDQELRVGQGEGLFMHRELDSPYSKALQWVPGLNWFRMRSEPVDEVCEHLEKSLTRWRSGHDR